MLSEGAYEMGVNLSGENINDFIVYLEELKIWSEKINLTGLKKDKDIIINHFLDSLSILKYIKEDSTLLDIGTGAGFPGLPVAIVHPKCLITCLDSAGKKIAFVNNIIRKLDLQNVKAVSLRAGENTEETAEKYDVVVTRAVSNIKNVIKLSSPYLNDDGRVIVMRGEKGLAELKAVTEELASLGIGIDLLDEFQLPHSGAKRVNIIFTKN
jgi:16S rRNA (guanine527-N7)-methyltransferase